MTKTTAILVMADGETWDTIEGASICIISEEDLDRLDEGDIDVKDLQPIFEIGLRDYTARRRDDEIMDQAWNDLND